MRKHEVLMPPDQEWFREAIRKLREMMPVQYITGETEFFGLKLKLTPAVLIPRPETEELVQWVLEDHSGERCRILDAGTGSGCIALALAKNLPDASIHACDVDKAALELAAENARRLGLEAEFFLHDLRSEEPPGGLLHLDVIVSNPSYIPEREKKHLPPNVRDFEPSEALFAPDEDPLIYYKHLSALAGRIQQPGGTLYVEIHEDFGQQVKELFGNRGFGEPEVRRDINGKERMVKARKT